MKNVRMMMMGVVCLCAAGACAAAVENFNGKLVDVEYWVGSGSNEAMLVLDFGGGDSYAFGYRWNDGDTFTREASIYSSVFGTTANANLTEAMLLALDGNGVGGTLDVQYYYNNSLGFSADSFVYDGKILGDAWVTTYPASYVSGHPEYENQTWEEVPPGSGNWVVTGSTTVPAMTPDGENWVYSNWGASTRELADGYYDGYSVGDASTWVSMPPVTPTPEPMSLGLLAIGGLAVLKKRRRG